MNALQDYENSLTNSRKEITKIFTTIIQIDDPQALLLFMLHYSGLSVSTTEPVEDWIRRAGKKTSAIGYAELGEKLQKHAIHESGHHLMVMKDTQALTKIWNQKFNDHLLPQLFIEQPWPKSVRQYRQLHEDCIASNTPYGQITIEYEIENLAVVQLPKLIEHCQAQLNINPKETLTFLTSHAIIDIHHTEYNRKALTEFLNTNPQALPALVEYGSQALNAYGNFLTDCSHLDIPTASS